MTTLASRHSLALACLWILVVAAPGTWAADKKIYRCGQTYQQVPCPADSAASARVINASDPRTAEQRSEGKAAASADKQQAKALEDERVRREKASQPQQAPMGTSMRPADPGASAPEAEPRTHARKHKKKSTEPDRYMPNKPPSDKV